MFGHVFKNPLGNKIKNIGAVLKFCFILLGILKDISQLQTGGISRTNNGPGLIKFDYN